MKKLFFLALTASLFLPGLAENNDNASEFGSEERTESGFLTSMLNDAIADRVESQKSTIVKNDEMQVGRTVTGFASAPKFGGYVIGRYSYNDQDGKHGGDGFNQRLVRFYVDGTILRDFAYRIQIQTNNDGFHMKDFFVEWRKYKFAMVKIGQFKRAFGFENPMNPWDISTGDYSLMTKYMTGHSDYLNKANKDKNNADYVGTANGGRDQGIQVQGDFLPVGKDKHMLFHYQIMVSNGPGINTSDNDGNKDITGTIQVQPIKGLFLGFFGWKGTFRDANSVDHSRNRYAFGAKYDNNGWCARGEYAHGQSDLGNADAWYVVGAAPINNWFRLSAQYQGYRPQKDGHKMHTQIALIPEFQLHKNLKFQIQYNYNINKAAGDKHYNEIVAQTYFRF